MDKKQKQQILESQKEMYGSLTEEQLKIVKEYCADNLKKLKNVCYLKVKKACGDSNMDEDDLYSIAMDVLVKSVKIYDKSQGNLETLLLNNIQNKFNTYIRDTKYRSKRSNVQKDDKGNPVYVPNASLDASAEDGIDLCEKLASDFNIEDELSKEAGFSSNEKVQKFLDKLGKVQRNILELLMQGYSSSEVKERLKITDREYSSAMSEIRKSKHLSLFNKKSKDRKAGMHSMEEAKVLEVMEIDTTDSYRMDKYNLLSLLNKKSEGEIDCNYISQRAPFQWDAIQINKFYTRILNNQPIPEIIICETREDGDKVAYLIDGLQRLSYAEWFRENRIKIGLKGAEFSVIKYRNYLTAENGKKIVDDKGRAKYEIETFDVAGKYYRDLPEFLQRRFDDFNVNVTTFFNCTEEMIDYHIRNYNNHCGMTKSQYGITSVNNFTSKNIKLISEEHDFFKNIIKCTPKNRIKGVLEEVAARSIMTLNFLTFWKKDVMDALAVVNDKATDEHYKNFRYLLDRLYAAGCEPVKDMFTTTNAHIWFAVFNRFIGLGAADSEFVKFMEKLQNAMDAYHNEGTSDFIDLDTYEIFTKRNTKDKAIVQEKINTVYTLLLKFLQISEEGTPVKENSTSDTTDSGLELTASVLEFVKHNVYENADPDAVELYKTSLNDYMAKLDEDAKQAVDKNIQSFVALVAYAYDKEEDESVSDWLVDFTNRRNKYNENQKLNYLFMKQDFEHYLSDARDTIGQARKSGKTTKKGRDGRLRYRA